MERSMSLEPWFQDLAYGGVSPANCTGDLHRPSCHIDQDEVAKRSLVALVRMIVSTLSLLGSFSIIVTVIVKKQVCSPKIHPIFMLAIADSFLGLTWIVGSSLWLLGGVKHQQAEREACFTVTVCTMILECVAVNLTLVYALLAYSNIKQKDFNNVYLLFNRDREVAVWKPWKTVTAYLLAWILPVVFILVPFITISSRFHIISHANNCSCWCLPYFGNVLPFAFADDIPTSMYLFRLKMFVASYAGAVGINYTFGFICLTIIYWKILRRIRQISKDKQARNGQFWYGVNKVKVVVSEGEKRAKFRVIAFLTIFVFVGFINTFMSIAIFVSELRDIAQKKFTVPYEPELSYYEYGLYLMQSSTLPLQGFLNALVYGWTREDFLKTIASRTIEELPPDRSSHDDRDSLEGSQSLLVSSTGEAPKPPDFRSISSYLQDIYPEHQSVNSRPSDLDTLVEVTEPEDSSDDSILYDGRPRSV